MTQAVSSRLSTAADLVRSQVSSCGICGGQHGTGSGFFLSTSVYPANSHSTKCPIFFICIVGGGIKVHSTLRPPNSLLCQPRVITVMEKSVEWLAGETEVLGEKLPQCRFVHHKPHMPPVREPGPPRWEASVNAPYSFVMRTGTIGQLVADVTSWLSLIPPPKKVN
jgi:hypothetical protein